MSLTMNMVGGGGGISGNRAVLVARVPSGSTVTASKGGVTLTPTMWVSETYPDQDIALFVFSSSQFDNVNPWTITATDGTNTASADVYVTSNKEYEVELSYILWLIRDGAFASSYETATGGYAATITPNYNSKCVQILSGQRSSSSSLMYFTPTISFPTAYQYLVCEYQVRGGHVTNQMPCFGVASVIPTVNNANNWASNTWAVYSELTASASNTFTAKTTRYIDISNVSGDFWVGLSEGGTSSQTGEFLCYNLYLTNDPPTT